MVYYKIPILRAGEKPDTIYLLALKKAIKSDGCSKVPDIYTECCVMHDLGYTFGIDVWGKDIGKIGADNTLRECMQRDSKLRWFSPVSWVYWFGVMAFGWKAYLHDKMKRKNIDFETYYWSGDN